MKTRLAYLVIAVLLTGCNRSYSPEIEDVLRQAGDNRSQLEKVLERYSRDPADSLKFRAAEFLIVNMPGKYSEYYDAPWNDVATVCLRWTSSSNKKLVLDTYKLCEPVMREDVKYITAEYLINNIELSFKVWQERPWGKHIPFDVFCEDILPYRISIEQLENWREKALASFADLDTELNNPTMTAIEACCKINDLLPRFRMDKDFPAMNFSQLMSSTRGTCSEMSSLTVFSMRALGIPVTSEFTPRWADIASGHSWNAVRDSAGNYISFMGADSNPYKSHQGVTLLKSKVYRKTFAIQHNIPSENENIPFISENDNRIKDVSANYNDCTDTVRVRLKYPSKTPSGYVYLAFEQAHQLYIVAWTAGNDSIAEFSSTGRGILYFPVYYDNTPASDPFWLDKTGKTIILSPDSPDTLMTFTSIALYDKNYTARMHHGVFEGANKPDFSDAKILYAIDAVPKVSYNEAELKSPMNCRYVRYKSPPNSYCNVAEIEFYGLKEEKLNGTNIGSSGSWSNSGMSCDKAFDNDVTTYYDAVEADGGWTGLDFHERKQIHKIRYLPRNYESDNICEGYHYELFYRTEDGWTSTGKQVAVGNTVQFHVPSRALMYLHNVTLNKKGKIFFIDTDNKIHWR
ncbi:MAG: transglutaminase-like domain-containing protein [Prevotellaceae bacterium]|jgi:hypothetical protein|nr:transglutaminase-like domain-containing protein [Prevotellaceae bacterium]